MLSIDPAVLEEHNTPAGIEALRAQVGGCPRDIHLLITNRPRIISTLTTAVKNMNDLRILEELLTDLFFSTSGLSHTFTLLQRANPVEDEQHTKTEDDAFHITMKGELAQEVLKNHVLTVNAAAVLQLAKTCMSAGSQAGVFAGHVFEGVAIRLICRCP